MPTSGMESNTMLTVAHGAFPRDAWGVSNPTGDFSKSQITLRSVSLLLVVWFTDDLLAGPGRWKFEAARQGDPWPGSPGAGV